MEKLKFALEKVQEEIKKLEGEIESLKTSELNSSLNFYYSGGEDNWKKASSSNEEANRRLQRLYELRNIEKDLNVLLDNYLDLFKRMVSVGVPGVSKIDNTIIYNKNILLNDELSDGNIIYDVGQNIKINGKN